MQRKSVSEMWPEADVSAFHAAVQQRIDIALHIDPQALAKIREGAGLLQELCNRYALSAVQATESGQMEFHPSDIIRSMIEIAAGIDQCLLNGVHVVTKEKDESSS